MTSLRSWRPQKDGKAAVVLNVLSSYWVKWTFLKKAPALKATLFHLENATTQRMGPEGKPDQL